MKRTLLLCSIFWELSTLHGLYNVANNTEDGVYLFAEDYGLSKSGSRDLQGVKMRLGFRHYTIKSKTPERESAFLSLYITATKGSIDWPKNITLVGSDRVQYATETNLEEPDMWKNLWGNDCHRLDFLSIQSPMDLVSFYKKNFSNVDDAYTFTLGNFHIILSGSDFRDFFKKLAKKSKDNVGYDLLAASEHQNH